MIVENVIKWLQIEGINMELKLQIFGCIYSVCFGYKTAWFGSLSFFTITREWHGDDQQVCDADCIREMNEAPIQAMNALTPNVI